MKKSIYQNTIGILIFVLIWFIVLFDPTGVAFGSKIITLPWVMVGMAEVLGNIIWLMGLFMLAASIGYIYVIFDEELHETHIKKAITIQFNEGILNISPFTLVNDHGIPLFRKRKWYNCLLLSLAVIGALLAIGSGFYFTGSMWLLTIFVSYLHRETGIELSRDIIKAEKKKVTKNR